MVVLSDLVKTFLDTEQDIHKQLETLGFERNTDNAVHQRNSPSNNNRSDDPFQFSSLEEERLLMSNEITTFDLCEDGPDLTSPSSVIYSLADGSNCVANSRNLSNNNFDTKNNGTTLNDVEDDVVLGASRRLSSAVERVLKILAETLNQRKNDYKEVLQQKNDLSIEIQEECERNHQLAKELIEKENRIKILETEQKTMKDQLVDYEEIKIQHERLKKKVEEYELEREQFQNDNKRLEMERRSFDQGLPQLHQSKLIQYLIKLFQKNVLDVYFDGSIPSSFLMSYLTKKNYLRIGKKFSLCYVKKFIACSLNLNIFKLLSINLQISIDCERFRSET